MEKVRITIENYSDTVCPWSYLGKKKLDRAIEAYLERHAGDVEFEVSWKPFILFPMAGRSGYKKRGLMTRLVGPKAPYFFERMERVGAEEGVKFAWTGMTGASLDSHKLILLAMEKDKALAAAAGEEKASRSRTKNGGNDGNDGKTTSSGSTSNNTPAPQPPELLPAQEQARHQWRSKHKHTYKDKVIDALFYGYFEADHDISDREFLVSTALSQGIASSETEVLAWMDDESIITNHATDYWSSLRLPVDGRKALDKAIDNLLHQSASNTTTSNSSAPPSVASGSEGGGISGSGSSDCGSSGSDSERPQNTNTTTPTTPMVTTTSKPAPVPHPPLVSKIGAAIKVAGAKATSQTPPAGPSSAGTRQSGSVIPSNNKKEVDITAVPSFLVQGHYLVGGMQNPEVFWGLFDKIMEREREQQVLRSQKRSTQKSGEEDVRMMVD